MRIQSAERLALLCLFSVLACGGSTAKSTGDSGLHDEDSGASRDGAIQHPDTGVPGNDAAQKANDGGIVNDATPGVCPATYAVAGKGANCDTADICIYDEGTCTCGTPGPTRPEDAGVNWSCTARPAGCPYAPPAENSACSDEGLSCDYGACIGGTARDCSGGVWTEGLVACPG